MGRQLVQRLAAQGDEVTALVWPAVTGETLRHLPVRIVAGDICDQESVMQAVKGQDTVYHCAGKVDDWGPREGYYIVNVEGTRNMLDASRAAGVRHVIYVSSLAVLGVPKTNPVDEAEPYTDIFFNPYQETKILSEKLVREFYAGHRLPVTIIRPGILWGLGDTTIFPRMERIAKLHLLVPIGKGDNIICLTYVPNLIDALVLAARVERPSDQIYHITDTEHITSKRYFSELAAIIGVKQLRGSLPLSLACATAQLSETASRLFQAAGIQLPPLITRYGITLWSTTIIAPPTKAREQLGYEQKVFFDEGMKTMAAWYADVKR